MTHPSRSAALATGQGGRVDTPVAVTAAAAIALLTGFVVHAIDLRQGMLVLVGSGFGFALYHGSFSFAGGWRAMLTEGRTASLRAQLVAIGLASLAIIPLLARGEFMGQPLTGALGPIGLSLAVGALLFGFGMQLGGGCASGTLFTVGGGSIRMLITLAFFIVGALLGTWHLPWWTGHYSLGVVLPAEHLGVGATLALQLLALAAIFWIARCWERHRRARIDALHRPPADSGSTPALTRVWQGAWPLLWASLALAILSVANLLLSGQPWSVTFAFNLWGAKGAESLGIDVARWEYWTWTMPAQALAGPIIAETTSVTNLGLVLGALLAAGLSGTFSPVTRIPLNSAIAAMLGGLLMGYGARLSFGCNIGALFSGIASGSLHGWLWFAFALAGTVAGVRARPLFGLEK